jgi:hypothetical protein
MKKIILFCLLLITTLISGCVQETSIGGLAPPMPRLNVTINSNPVPEGTKVPIIVDLLSSKGEPMPNELIYINLTKEIENRVIVDNMVTVTYNTTIEPYEIYTDTDGNAVLNYDAPLLTSYKSCDSITISILWKNSTGSGLISTERNLAIYTTRPTYSIQSFGLNPIAYMPSSNKAYLLATITPRTEGGNLYNLGPINFTIIQESEINSVTAYTNCVGQADIEFVPKHGFVEVRATYQNFSDTVNTTIP